MALKLCKECGSTFSTKAKACVNCGAEVRRTTLLTWIASFVILGVIYLVISFLSMETEAVINRSVDSIFGASTQ